MLGLDALGALAHGEGDGHALAEALEVGGGLDVGEMNLRGGATNGKGFVGNLCEVYHCIDAEKVGKLKNTWDVAKSEFGRGGRFF